MYWISLLWQWLFGKTDKAPCRVCSLIKQISEKTYNSSKSLDLYFVAETKHCYFVWGHKDYHVNTVIVIYRDTCDHTEALWQAEKTKNRLEKIFAPVTMEVFESEYAKCHGSYRRYTPHARHEIAARQNSRQVYRVIKDLYPDAEFFSVEN